MKFAVRNIRGEQYAYYWCGGCGHAHGVPAKRWNWDGDTEAPTLSPSVRHYIPAGEGRPEKTTCHYFLRKGVLEYCGDCEHPLSGQKVPLQEIPDNYGIPGDDNG